MILHRESTFTRPRPDCRHPEYWHSTDCDSTEVEVTELVAAFVRALQPELVVETGTAWGQTAEWIGKALAANGHGRLDTLETDPERVKFCRERLSGLPVRVIEGESLHYVPDARVGFAWFDSLLHLRAEEFRAYRPAMAPGCIVGFHDCGPQHPIRGIVEQLPIRPIYLPTPRGVVFGEVR